MEIRWNGYNGNGSGGRTARLTADESMREALQHAMGSNTKLAYKITNPLAGGELWNGRAGAVERALATVAG